jgi:dipeptidyl aminopeptidase
MAVLEDNSKMRTGLLGYALPTQTYGSVQGHFDTLNSFQISPPGFANDCSKQYPVLINVYGGPGAQMIQAKATIGAGNGFHTYLSSSHNYIIYSVDAVGTGCKYHCHLTTALFSLLLPHHCLKCGGGMK